MSVKRAVITLHGIRTRGAWQKALDPELAKWDFVPYPLDYGYFSAPAMVSPLARKKRLNWFRQEYDRIVASAGVARPSIICHSFGTYMTAHVLRSYDEVKFDRIILAGSIIDPAYAWQPVFDRDQALWIHNEYASDDIWPKIAGHVPLWDAGPSGRTGFGFQHERFSEHSSPRGHDVAAYATHFETWIRILRRPILSKTDQEIVRETLSLVPGIVARGMRVPAERLRCNVFVLGESGRHLVIPPGAHYNMDNPDELRLAIPVGMGCTGKAFQERTLHVAILHEGWWGQHDLPADLLRLVHRDLRWIMSFPVLDAEDGRIRGIMNVDCLSVEKSLQDLTDGPGPGNDLERERVKKMYGDIGTVIQTLAEHLTSLEQGAL
jgi:hypothetical protein